MGIRELKCGGAMVNADHDRLAQAMTEGTACLQPREWPISQGPCSGECIIADVMESQWLGVVIFDLERLSLLFVNRVARDLFRRLRRNPDYETLSELLLSLDLESDSECPSRDLRLGSRLLGYTVYRSQKFAWVYVKDITNKARLESIAEAVETMNNIGLVFSAVRHELGNPINSVKAALSVLRANVETYPRETVTEYLDRIASEMGRVENLLRSLKSFSLYEQPNLQVVDVGAFVDQFVKLIAEEAHQNGIAVEVAFSDGCAAICDPRALQQVMLNLFANATDALRGRENPELRILVTQNDGLVSLRMADNGIGMPDDEVQNLFKPFFTTKENGTGLGLVISRKLLAKMGATITLESTEGKGTIVHIAIPESQECQVQA